MASMSCAVMWNTPPVVPSGFVFFVPAASAEEAPAASMLNLDKSGISADGLTDLQVRLKLVDETEGMEDAVKAANITLTAEETSELEALADSLELNVIRFWEKEMK